MHRYFPDIYIATEDKFIEVKSDYTMELQKEKNIAKGQCVKKAGYDFEFWIFDKKEVLIEILKL